MGRSLAPRGDARPGERPDGRGARRLGPRRALGALALAVVATLSGVAAGQGLAGSALEGWFADRALQVLRRATGGPGAGPPRVVVVGLDADTLASEGFRGIPRPLMGRRFAEVGEIALEAGAVAVGFDLIFAFSADDYVDPRTGERPLRGFDRDFLAFLHRNRDRVVVARSASLLPHRRVLAAAGASGAKLTEVAPDADGVIRRRTAGGSGSTGAAAPDHIVDALIARAAPSAPPAGPYRPLPAAKLQTALPYLSVGAVLACSRTAEGRARLADLFGGRVAILGGVLPDEDEHLYGDRFLPPTDRPAEPCGSQPPPPRTPVAGAFILADLVNAPLTGALARPAPPLAVAGVLAAFALAASAFGLGARPGLYPLVAVLAAGALAVPVVLLGVGIEVPPASPLAAVLVAFALAALGRNGLLMRHERRLKRLFGHYLAPAVIEEMARSGDLPALAGERRHVVVGFVDIAGSSAFAEANGDAATLAMVNGCFDAVCEILMAHDAYIDKFMGDGVLAVWNAPNAVARPEERAVAAARAILAALPEIRRRSGHPGLGLRIALHAGEALVGSVGGSGKRAYTVMGNTVNVASRLEEVAKAERVALVVSDAVLAALADGSGFVPVWRGRLRGLAGEVEAHAPRPASGAGHAA